MSFITEPTILAALTGAIVSIISALYALFRKKTEKEDSEKELQRLRRKAAQISLDLGVVKFTQSLESGADTLPKEEILEQLEGRIMRRIAEQPNSTDESIHAAVQSDLSDFKKRIEKIENRFPEESKIEKIASINDALLSERIDQIKERLDRLENKILTKWDVALTVSTIIAGIAFIVGATYAIIKFIGKVP